MAKHERVEIGSDGLKTEAQRARLAEFVASKTGRYLLLGGTTYEHSIWAIRYSDGSIHVWQTPHDPCGRWVRAACRPWNAQCDSTYKIEAWDSGNGRWDEGAVVGSASVSENRFTTRAQADAKLAEYQAEWPDAKLRVSQAE